MAKQKRILISISDSLLSKVDDKRQEDNLSRSEFIKEATLSYIKEKSKSEIMENLKEGYEKMAKINLEYSDLCLKEDNRQLELYENMLRECEWIAN